MRDQRFSERMRRLFGAGVEAERVGESALGASILALASRCADLHRRCEEERAWAESGDGVWPVEGLLTVEEFAALHGIDLDGLDAGGGS